MARKDAPPEGLRKLTQWFDQPLTPGKQKELTDWLAADPDHQLKWERWSDFNAQARQLQIVPSDVSAEWAKLRDDLGLGRSSRKRSRRFRSRKKKKSLLKSPIVVASISMAFFALFLFILHLIRTSSGF